MSAIGIELRRRYSRSDARGNFPRVSGAPELSSNRLGIFWRPIVDMAHSDLAAVRLRMIRPVAEWIAAPLSGRVSWFSRIGVPGLRRQVLRHAGLEQYDCARPQDLPVELRSPAWQQLVDVLDGFADLDYYTRALVVFQLAQLSFCHLAIALAGAVTPNGDPGRDHYAYQVARVHARIPGKTDQALPVFEALTANHHDSLLAMLAAAQGVSHGIRSKGDTAIALRFEEIGRHLDLLPGDWRAHLTRSRFHRGLALIRLAELAPTDMRNELEIAWYHHGEMTKMASADDICRMVVTENKRILIESEIKACFRTGATETATKILAWADELSRIDPNCVEARLVVGDGHAAVGDLVTAARWYAHAGELGTVSGAVGWYRAAQCYDHLGDQTNAINAMGHCLELDTTAIEPRQYLANWQNLPF